MEPECSRSCPSHHSGPPPPSWIRIHGRLEFSFGAYALDILIFPEHTAFKSCPTSSRTCVHCACPSPPILTSTENLNFPVAIPLLLNLLPVTLYSPPDLPSSFSQCSEDAAALYEGIPFFRPPFPMHAQPALQVMRTAYSPSSTRSFRRLSVVRRRKEVFKSASPVCSSPVTLFAQSLDLTPPIIAERSGKEFDLVSSYSRADSPEKLSCSFLSRGCNFESNGWTDLEVPWLDADTQPGAYWFSLVDCETVRTLPRKTFSVPHNRQGADSILHH